MLVDACMDNDSYTAMHDNDTISYTEARHVSSTCREGMKDRAACSVVSERMKVPQPECQITASLPHAAATAFFLLRFTGGSSLDCDST